MNRRLSITLLGLALVGFGLYGPVVLIDGMGQYNLFELTERTKDSAYTWIAIGLLVLVVLAVLATVFRMFVSVWLLTMSGIIAWVVGWFFYREAVINALNKISKYGHTEKPAEVHRVVLENMDLHWGAYCILGGLLILFIASLFRR
jgi:hypothetical protein